MTWATSFAIVGTAWAFAFPIATYFEKRNDLIKLRAEERAEKRKYKSS